MGWVITLQFLWRDVHESAAGLDLQGEVHGLDIVQDVSQVLDLSPLRVVVHASLQGSTCFVQGTITADVTYRCSRCLTEVADKLSIPFAEAFVRCVPADGDSEDERHAVAGEEIILDPWIRQDVLLALPYRPLCRQDCAGLCPVCGGNRNIFPCQCGEKQTDPRWAELANFFKQP